jgi:hypothetical protein
MAREHDVSMDQDHALDQARSQDGGTGHPATSPDRGTAPELHPESARHFERPDAGPASGAGEGASIAQQIFENGSSRRLTPSEYEQETKRRAEEIKAQRRLRRQRRRPTIQDFLKESRDRYDFEE